MADEIESPGLDELRRELQAVGMVVVPFGDEIHVRRSTLEYIKVRVDAGVLRCETYIGTMSQAKATWALLAAEMIIDPSAGLRVEAGDCGAGCRGHVRRTPGIRLSRASVYSRRGFR